MMKALTKLEWIGLLVACTGACTDRRVALTEPQTTSKFRRSDHPDLGQQIDLLNHGRQLRLDGRQAG